MGRRERRDRREEIFAVQSEVEEESAIETILTDTEEDWTATLYAPEPSRRPRSSARRSRSQSKVAPKVLKRNKQRRVKDNVPWDHHQKHRHSREPVGISEKIDRRLAERQTMAKSTSRKPAVVYDEDDDSFLPSYDSDADEDETNVTSISELKRQLKKKTKMMDKKKSKKKSKSKSSSKADKKSKKGRSKRSKRRRKKGGDELLDGLMETACKTTGDVYGAACKMVDKAFQLDSSDEDSSSEEEDDSSSEDETAITAASETVITAADETAITAASETVITATSTAVTSFEHSGTTAATSYNSGTMATGYTEATPAPPPKRRSRREQQAPRAKRSPSNVPHNNRPTPTTPTAIRGRPMPPSVSPKKKELRYRQVVAPPGKLGLSLKSTPQGPTIKMVSRHCPVHVNVGDVIARVNGKSVLWMDSRDVMQMFATMQKREKVIDLLPSLPSPTSSHRSPQQGPIATPTRRGPGPSAMPPLTGTRPSSIRSRGRSRPY